MRSLLLTTCASLCLAACEGGTTAVDAGATDQEMTPADLGVTPDATPPTVYTVFIRGQLKNDVATSKGIHDQIVAGGQARARMLGDSAHYTFLNLSTPVDGGAAAPSDQFLGIDEWSDLGGFMKFTSDPGVQAAFAMLFAAPPTVSVTVHPSGWTEWGKLDPSGQGAPLYLFSVRAPLAASTTEKSRMDHNQVAGGGMSQAQQAGDVAHQVFLGASDAKQFQAVDLWTNLNGPMAVYSSPAFQAGFATVFSAPPVVDAYVHSDWAQY